MKTINRRNVEKRIIDISYKLNLNHIGSCITSYPIICDIYEQMQENDIFVLSNGHAGLALYAVLEDVYGFDAEKIYSKHGTHPAYDTEYKIYCSSGSLGCGLPIAVGYALSDNHRDVYCLISDGECAEGSIWEALQFIYTHNITNLHVYVNANGYSALDAVNLPYLVTRLNTFLPTINIRYTDNSKFTFLTEVDAHYYKMTREDYESIIF